MRLERDEAKSIYLRGGRVIDPAHGLDEISDLLVENNTIVAMDKGGRLEKKAKAAQAQLLDVKDLIVAPGFIDLNARMGEPGSDPAESLASSSLAAAAGGFTSVACMPSFATINDNAFMTDYILRHSYEKSLVRLFPIGALTLSSAGEKLAEIGSMVEAGVVAVTDDGRSVMDSYLMRKALEYAKAFNVPVFSFPQDKNLVGRGVMDEGLQSCRLGLRGIPAAAEEIMVARDIVLAKHAESRLHFSSISTKGSVQAIREAKAQGVAITAETNPQYFSLTSDDLVAYNANYKFFPPLRGHEQLDAIIDALADGTLDAIASMHMPQSPSSKDMVFEYAAPGMAAFETLLPLCLELVHKQKISLERMISLLTIGPAKILGLHTKGIGTLKVGGVADIVVFALDTQYEFTESRMVGSAKNNPFIGKNFRGATCYTIVNGIIAFRSPE